jgi:hypothetical protein
MEPHAKPATTKFSGKSVVDSGNIDIENAVQPAAEATNGKGIELDTDQVFSTDALDDERFWRDELTVVFMEPATEADPPFVECTVNGIYKLAYRDGTECKLPRSHVQVLAQAKQSRVRQKKLTQADGSIGYVEETVLSLTYPFAVQHDPNPRRGGPWLRQLLRNPG